MNRRIRSGTFSGFVVALGLAGASQALATTTTAVVTGTMSPTQETCLQGLTVNVGDGENCMYDGGPSSVATAVPFGEVTGPYNQISYYDSLQTPAAFQSTINGQRRVLYAPVPGDGKIAQVIDGTLSIDDNGNGFGADDKIGFTLNLKSPGAGSVVRSYGSSVVDRYDGMTQVLAPRAVNSATPNAASGFDYVIGSEGFPGTLTYSGDGGCLGEVFGFVECPHSFGANVTDADFWNGLSAAGIGSLESNLGAKTTGTVTNLACIDSRNAAGVESNDCRDSQVSYAPWIIGPCIAPAGCSGNESTAGSVRGAAEDVGWDQLLLKVSTDGSGKIIAVEGFNVEDYRVFGVTRCGDNTTGTGSSTETCNSWTTGYFTLSAVTGGQAVDDGPLFATPGFALDIPVMVNDTDFNDPVTVTVTTNPGQGVTLVSGSAGPASGISIRYTANAGATVTDSFVYTVTDGVSTDTATVTLNIGPGANPDFVTTGRTLPIQIRVAANDPGFDNTVTVTVNNDISAGGSATVTAGNGGPGSGVVVTYTPVAPPADGYTDTFTYTIDDGVLPPATALVTVEVVNRKPNAVAANVAVSTTGKTPTAATGEFNVQTENLGDPPSTVVIDDPQPMRGTATVSGSRISYAITDDTFFTGLDTIHYTITDFDGETSSGVLTVQVAEATPEITQSYIVTGQDKVSVPLKPKVTLGNGADTEHTLAVTGQGTHGSCSVSPADGTGKITYTPEQAGYTGPDSCQVTLTDGDGDAVVGAVSVKITTLGEIGGASSLDPWSLMLLAVAPLLRRLRRRAPGSPAGRSGHGARGFAGVAASVVLTAGFGARGQAQEAPAAEPERNSAAIEEIVVTARKVEENLQEVPLAITAFDSNTIEQKGITSLSDVAALTPGLSFFNAFGENLPVPVIRGIAPTDIFGQNNAAIFVDGVYISGREGLNFSQIDVARIEVVKGPQSALYGRNAFSGAINYVTKPPSDVFEGKTSVEVGNAGRVKGQASVSGPIWGDSLRGRIAGLYEDFDGTYSNPIVDNDIGGHRFRSFQGALLWLPAEDWEVNLSYYKSNDDIDESPNVALPTNCEDRVNDNNASIRYQNFCGEVPDIGQIPGLNGLSGIPKVAQATGENRELDRANLKIDWDLHDYGSLSALTGYSKTQQNSVSDFAHSLGENQSFLYCSPAENTPGIPNACGANPANKRFFSGVFDREPGGETEEWSQELRYTSTQDQRLRYTGGAYYYHVDETGFSGGPIATQPLPEGGAIGLPPIQDSLAIGTAIFYDTFTPDGGADPLTRKVSDDNTDGWAIFAGADFDITDRLIGRAELRYSDEKQEVNNLRYAKCYTTDGGGCVYPGPNPSAPDATDTSKTGDDKYDLRVLAPLPAFGPDCLITTIGQSVIPGTPGQCSGSGSASFDSITGRVGLDFKINDEWMVYGSIAYGEKPGGLQLAGGREIVQGGAEAVVIESTFDPEELTAYELGLKGAFWDGRATISTAVFYNDWQKIVLRQLVENNPENGALLEQPVALQVNAGDAGVWGFELEANAGFTENLTGRFTLGWADATLKNAQQDTYEAFPTFAPDGDVSDNKLLRQPEWLLSASLDYQHPISDDWEWYAGGDANYQSGVYVGNDNQGWLPAHTYVNTRLGLRNGQYTVEFWTRNLFNDGHAIAAFRDIYWGNTADQYKDANGQYRNDSGPEPDFDGFVPLRYTVTYPNERTYGLNFQYRFGGAVR